MPGAVGEADGAAELVGEERRDAGRVRDLKGLVQITGQMLAVGVVPVSCWTTLAPS